MELQENAAYIQSVLSRYGFRNVRSSSNGFTASCIFHEDKHPSFSISRKGLWMCWSCSKRGSLKGLHRALGGGEQDWKDSLKELGVQLRSRTVVKKKNDRIDLPIDFKKYRGSYPEAIAKRLKPETIEHFELGSSDTGMARGRCIIPIKFKGAVVGWHGRALSASTELRYYNPAGFDIKEHVFNYDSCKNGEEVILVEGAFNAMSMWEKGFKNVVAVFGTQFTSGQIGRIMSMAPSSIVIAFDRDKSKIVDGVERGHAGQRAARKIGALVHDAIPTYIMPLPIGRDPNDIDVDILGRCYDKRVSYESIFGGSDEVQR